jgi:hypothetical protein
VPNTFSQDLMNSLAVYQGVPPAILAGCNTQDEIYFDRNLDIADLWLDGVKFDWLSTGPPFLDTFNLWPKGTQLSYGIDLKNTSAGAAQNMIEAVTAACQHGIDLSNLAYWELGNEPDNYPGSQYNGDMSSHVCAWQSGAQGLQDAIAQACPSFASVKFMAPSFSYPGKTFNETAAFQAGLGSMNNIGIISSHQYVLRVLFSWCSPPSDWASLTNI